MQQASSFLGTSPRNGPVRSTCQLNGTWTTKFPKCKGEFDKVSCTNGICLFRQLGRSMFMHTIYLLAPSFVIAFCLRDEPLLPTSCSSQSCHCSAQQKPVDDLKSVPQSPFLWFLQAKRSKSSFGLGAAPNRQIVLVWLGHEVRFIPAV